MIVHKLVPFFILMLDLLLLGSALATSGRNERNRSFTYLIGALSVWLIGVLGLRWSTDDHTALLWERLLHVGVVAIPAVFYDYVWVLLGQRRWRPTVVTAYALAAVFFAVIATPLFITGVTATPWGYAPTTGPLYPLFLAYFLGYMALGLGVLLREERRIGSTFRRNRLRLVIIGVTVSLLGGLIDFGRFLFDMEWVYPAGVPASGVFALALGVAIVRYRLMSVSALGRRALLYALTWTATAPALLVALEVVDEVARVTPIEAPPGTVKTIVLLSILMLALPFMRKLESLLNRIMFHRQRAIADVLVTLNRELFEIVDVPTLASRLTSGLVTRIPLAHATLYGPVGQGEGVVPLARATAEENPEPDDTPFPPGAVLWVRATRRTLPVDRIGYDASSAEPGVEVMDELERRQITLVVPIFVEGHMTALLALGEKLSGDVFEGDEIELIEVLAGRVGMALRNARLYEDLTAQMTELRKTRNLYGQARQAERAKEEFLAMLAHELRGPLAPIVNAAHVLDAVAGEEPKAAPMIGIIRRQGLRLARIVDDLLDVSRIQLGKIRLDLEVLDLRTLVGQCLETLRTSGKGHGREVRAVMTKEPLAVRGDPVRLEQVLWNLLDNALKYSLPNTPVVVSVERDGDTAVVRIVDQGIGIAPEVLPHVFELFTQADTSLHRSQGGLGLGLSLVRSLVEQHHGSVSAASPGLGRGSEFVVRLPLVIGADERVAHRRELARPALSRRVLIVDDAADARESLRLLIELHGATVDCVADGQSAVRVALEASPDVALIDVGLPDIDGYEVARRIRAARVGRDIYLVALTGYGQADDRRQALESGFDAHFVKPIDPDELRRIISGAVPPMGQIRKEPE